MQLLHLLYRIVTNVCLDHLRGVKRARRPISRSEFQAITRKASPFSRAPARVSPDTDPERTFIGKEIKAADRHGDGTAVAAKRIVFEMKHFQGLKLRGLVTPSADEETVEKTRFFSRRANSATNWGNCDERLERRALREICPAIGLLPLRRSERQGTQTDWGHVANCRACAAQLGEESPPESHACGFANPPMNSTLPAFLLSQCRSELAEALRRFSAPPLEEYWRPFGGCASEMALRPPWSGALLVFLWDRSGNSGCSLAAERNSGDVNSRAVNVTAKPPLTMSSSRIWLSVGINLSPSSDSGAPACKCSSAPSSR